METEGTIGDWQNNLYLSSEWKRQYKSHLFSKFEKFCDRNRPLRLDNKTQIQHNSAHGSQSRVKKLSITTRIRHRDRVEDERREQANDIPTTGGWRGEDTETGSPKGWWIRERCRLREQQYLSTHSSTQTTIYTHIYTYTETHTEPRTISKFMARKTNALVKILKYSVTLD